MTLKSTTNLFQTSVQKTVLKPCLRQEQEYHWGEVKHYTTKPSFILRQDHRDFWKENGEDLWLELLTHFSFERRANLGLVVIT